MLYAVHRILFRESIFSVYAVVIPVRPLFATSSLVSLTAGTHSDTVFGTALRRACGASCIRLLKMRKKQIFSLALESFSKSSLTFEVGHRFSLTFEPDSLENS